MPKKIAIVEDEAELAALIEYNLVRHGYEAQVLGGSKGTLRLLRVSCSIAEDGSAVELEAVFGKGAGPNPDAYDEDGYRVRLALPSLDRDDLEDGVALDVFADELGRISRTKMVAMFHRGVLDLETFAVVRDARVLSAEVERTS